MIYITVGNHDQPFDRFLTVIDDLAQKLGLEAVMQKGVSKYVPKHCEASDYFPFSKSEEFFQTAQVVVGHAGIGTVISALKWKTPLIICPRRREYGEHLNDHQLEISRELSEKPRPGIEVAMETGDIEQKLVRLLAGEHTALKETHMQREELKKVIRGFLDSV